MDYEPEYRLSCTVSALPVFLDLDGVGCYTVTLIQDGVRVRPAARYLPLTLRPVVYSQRTQGSPYMQGIWHHAL